jgi:hypothetical protein
MPALTRRREQDRPSGMLAGLLWRRPGRLDRPGVPKDVAQWGWNCGFSPGSDRGIRQDGIAETFDQARAAFATAWQNSLPRCTDANFTEHRYQRAWTGSKYAMWDASCRLPSQTVSGVTTCFCGVMINARTSGDHIRACHMEFTSHGRTA